MKLIRYARSHFGWKLFLSYLIVAFATVTALASSARFMAATAYHRNLASILYLFRPSGRPLAFNPETILLNTFQRGMIEALAYALIVALAVALVASLLISRQVVAPLNEMTNASQRIADGHYTERVNVPGDLSSGEPDELGQLALSFNQMAARLEHTENIRRQLIGDVAHELRTPLTTIKGSLEALIDGVLPADGETYQQIYAEAGRMQRLVDDLQELSRVESGAYELALRRSAVSELVNSAVQRMGRAFEEKAVQLEVDVPASLPAVMVDEERIGQVMVNLLGNALQFTPGGGKVRISAARQGNEIRFGVSDTGIGVEAEHLPLLFTRFYRVDASRSRSSGGSGIGLTIARALVEMHGGRIWAESPGLGQGSAFYFTLPVDEG
jgi:signal transduction histidine kinase